jgi:NADH dehydrogenase
LGDASVRVTLVDRNNVPLLYQLATAALSPANIAEPIRRILARNANTDVAPDELVATDPIA